jgi:hypothetical protein
MVFQVTILGLLLTFLPNAQPPQTRLRNSDTEQKAIKIRKVMEIVDEFERLARLNDVEGNGTHVNGYLSQASINQIGALLKELPDSESLAKLGVICGHIAHPQDASHVGYDAVFDRAMWEIAEMLAIRTDKDAVYGLMLLKQSHGADGHGSEQLNELMEKQRKLKSSSQNKSRAIR